MVYTDGIILVTDGPAVELHSFVHILGLSANWVICHENPYYRITSKNILVKALSLGAQPVPSNILSPNQPFSVTKMETAITSHSDVIDYHLKVVAHYHKNLLDVATSQYTREDLLILKKTLSSYHKLESAKIVYDILGNVEDVEETERAWVKEKFSRLDSEYSFVIDFFRLPFTRIPLVINKYGKEGIAFIILTWRLEIGK